MRKEPSGGKNVPRRISGSSRREFLGKVGMATGFLLAGLQDTHALLDSTATATDSIGATLIPFYTGNLSVTPFMIYWGTAKESALPKEEVDVTLLSTLRSISVFADVDYLAWCLAESNKGTWDFAYYANNAKRLNDAGFKYVVFCWVHFPPKWAKEGADFTPYARLEDGVTTRQLSPWDPRFEEIYDRFYAALSHSLGSRIDFLRVGYPSEYGEMGYPNGMTTWLVPQEHFGPGFWCADPHAKADFRRVFLERYSSLKALNKAWGTEFANEQDISMPEAVNYATATLGRNHANVQARRRWLDFVNWYQDHVDICFSAICEVIRRHFPGKRLVGSLGYGSEQCSYGNDTSRHVKMLKKINACAQTPGAIGYFATRRVSSACHFYKTPYYTEPPGTVDPMDETKRIWMDSTNGCQVYFDYPDNLKGAIPEFREYKKQLNGDRSITDFAYLFPSSSFWLEASTDWPIMTYELGEHLRYRLDYELIDEQMIQDGALQAMGIKTLAWVEGAFAEAKTLDMIRQWVHAGGVLIRRKNGETYDLEGREVTWLHGISAGDCTRDYRRVWRDSLHSLGAGKLLLIQADDSNMERFAQCMMEFSVNRTLYDSAGMMNTMDLNPGNIPNVYLSLFKDRILILNDSRTNAVDFPLRLREEDFLKRHLPLPETLTATFHIPPRSIRMIRLKKG